MGLSEFPDGKKAATYTYELVFTSRPFPPPLLLPHHTDTSLSVVSTYVDRTMHARAMYGGAVHLIATPTRARRHERGWAWAWVTRQRHPNTQATGGASRLWRFLEWSPSGSSGLVSVSISVSSSSTFSSSVHYFVAPVVVLVVCLEPHSELAQTRPSGHTPPPRPFSRPSRHSLPRSAWRQATQGAGKRGAEVPQT